MGFNLGGAVQGAITGGASGGWWGAGAGALAGGLSGSGGGGGSGSPKHIMNTALRQANKNIDMYEGELGQLGGYYNPYMESGKFANTQIGNMLGQNGQAAADTAWNQSLSPGARFLEQQQNAALLRNKAALGDVGGNQLAALTNQSNLFNFGQAQQYMNNLQNLQGVGIGATNDYQKLRAFNTGNIADYRDAKVAAVAGGGMGMNADRNAALASNLQLGGALAGIGNRIGNYFNPVSGNGVVSQGGYDPNGNRVIYS